MAEQADNLVLQHLRGLRADFADVGAELKVVREGMATKAELRADLNSLRADVGSDLLEMRRELTDKIEAVRKETREQMVGVRRAMTEYHSAVVGHGMRISDLEERVRRLERHRDLPAPGSH